jgi:hypothetical protein
MYCPVLRVHEFPIYSSAALKGHSHQIFDFMLGFIEGSQYFNVGPPMILNFFLTS